MTKGSFPGGNEASIRVEFEELELLFQLNYVEPKTVVHLLEATFGPLQISQDQKLIVDATRNARMISLVELAVLAAKWICGDSQVLFYGASSDPDLAFFVIDEHENQWSMRSEVWPWAVLPNSIDPRSMKQLLARFVIAVRTAVHAKWGIDCTGLLLGETDDDFSPVTKRSQLSELRVQDLFDRQKVFLD